MSTNTRVRGSSMVQVLATIAGDCGEQEEEEEWNPPKKGIFRHLAQEIHSSLAVKYRKCLIKVFPVAVPTIIITPPSPDDVGDFKDLPPQDMRFLNVYQ